MFLALTLLACASFALHPPEDPIDLDEARRIFEEAAALSRAEGGKLWGRELYGPLLFADRSTRFAVANQKDAAGELLESGGVFVGTLPEHVPLANTAVTWSGVEWTMVLWPLSKNRYVRGKLLAHELYHRIQDDLGLAPADALNPHLDSADGRIWLRLEGNALVEALIRDKEERRRAASDALLFRARRHGLFPDAADAERLLELNEGLAEYTGWRASGLPESVLPDRAALALEERLASGSANLVRGFAYATGPAYALLLDLLRPDWRKGLSLESDLSQLLAGALAWKAPEDLAAASDAATKRYDGPRILQEERARESKREARLAELRRRFFDGPVLVLPLGSQVSYEFDPNHVEAYDDSSSVYDPLRLSDAWGILTVEGGGALVVRDGSMPTSARVSAPADPAARPLHGDGWTLELADGWKLVPGERAGDFALVRGGN